MHSRGQWAWVKVWAWVAFLWVTEGKDMTPWRKVLVESSWFKPTVLQSSVKLSPFLCGVTCTRNDWCQLWGHDESGQCLLTNLTVSGSYVPSTPENAASYYTNRPPDLATGASITSSRLHHSTLKQRENIVDGIYGGDILDCALVDSNSDALAWFLIDLGKVLQVSEVLLIAQPNSNSEHYFRDLEVKIGDVEESGNFESYSLIGTYAGPGEPEEVVVMRPAAPVYGRYVSIQKRSSSLLQIAHLEIR